MGNANVVNLLLQVSSCVDCKVAKFVTRSTLCYKNKKEIASCGCSLLNSVEKKDKKKTTHSTAAVVNKFPCTPLV